MSLLKELRMRIEEITDALGLALCLGALLVGGAGL
jgi:hypothetical protein